MVLASYIPAYRQTYSHAHDVLSGMGLSEKDIWLLITFWYTYARNTLGQTGYGANFYVQQQIHLMVTQWSASVVIGSGVTFWPFVLLGIALVAVAAGLYVWVQLDTMDHFQHEVNDQAYVLRLGEEMRECELAYVGPDDRGIYEEGGTWGPVITSVDPDVPILGGTYDMFHFFGGIRLRRRWAAFHYVWRWYYWVVKYIGDVYRVEHKLYRLKKPTLDPYAPPG
ncbi:unnamed protein product, partial [marine sediment metagenome]